MSLTRYQQTVHGASSSDEVSCGKTDVLTSSQGQGHGVHNEALHNEALHNQNVIVSAVSSKLLNLLQANCV